MTMKFKIENIVTDGQLPHDIELVDILKERVYAGHPIYVNGDCSGEEVQSAIMATAGRIAEETGRQVRLVHVVDLPAGK